MRLALLLYRDMPLRKLVTAQGIERWSDEDLSQFYATSWAFVHYLYFSGALSKDAPNRWAQKDKFLSLLNQGADPEASFKEAFGMDFNSMQRDLERYLASSLKGYGFPVERLGAVREPEVHVLGAAEALTRLGDLLIVFDDSKRAVELLESAVALDPEQPRARALLARALGKQDRHDEAQAMFAQALKREPDSALTHLDYARYLSSLSVRRGDDYTIQATAPPGDRRAELLRLARSEFERSIALDARIPEAHAELAFTYLTPGEHAELGIAPADEAFALLPSQNSLALQLAEILIAAGKPDQARPVLTRLRPQAARSRQFSAYVDQLLARTQEASEATTP